MKNKQNAAFSGSPKGKVSRARHRAEKKAARKAQKDLILPIHKRPVVCPPDKAGRSPLFRYGGLICRALVIWLAAAGLMIFIASAAE